MKNNSSLIKIENLTFYYCEKKILDDISFEIKENEILGIAGRNGSGKSTLGKIFAGLLKPTVGEIKTSLGQGDISLVFQNPNNQIIGNRVIDDLAFALENRGINREEMLEKINCQAKKLGIENLLDKDPHELSGGEKQLVAIAGILIFNPKIIIFDEITSMLDRISKKLLNEVIQKIKNNHTIIMITHDPEELILCDRIICLEKGKLISDSSPENFYASEQNSPFLFSVQKFLESKGKNQVEVKNWLSKLK
ncbi:MAG: energy-coupling factor ABC transporter ATP-binding protein [Fusobacteriaceae bacterium]